MRPECLSGVVALPNRAGCKGKSLRPLKDPTQNGQVTAGGQRVALDSSGRRVKPEARGMSGWVSQSVSQNPWI